MATCEKRTFVPPPAPPPKPIIEYKLVLSEEEACTLLTVLRRIGGSPDGPRGKIDGIREALEGKGVNHTDSVFESYKEDVHPTALYFTKKEE